MGKNKVRTKKKVNGERWAKGQSSSSNPTKTKFRNAAKSKFLNHGGTAGSDVFISVFFIHLDITYQTGVTSPQRPSCAMTPHLESDPS